MLTVGGNLEVSRCLILSRNIIVFCGFFRILYLPEITLVFVNDLLIQFTFRLSFSLLFFRSDSQGLTSGAQMHSWQLDNYKIVKYHK